METYQVLMLIVVIFFLLGLFAFLIYFSRLSKRYVAYTNELKKVGKYKEWVSHHKGLVIFEKICLYISIATAIATIIFFFGMRNSVNSQPSITDSPNIITTIAGALYYLFIPFLLISSFVNLRLYKKVPKEWK